MSDQPVYSLGRRRSSAGNCVLYGGIGCGVIIILLAIGTFLVVRNFKSIATEVARKIATSAVEGSQLPNDQKKQVVAHIDRVADDYKAGRITDEQIVAVMEKIVESPLLPLTSVMVIDQVYVQPSALTPDEKKEAQMTLQRFARGVHEKTIPDAEQSINDVLEPISTRDANGKLNIKKNPTADELRDALSRAKVKADAANVPEEKYDLNIAEELGRVIEDALGSPAPMPAAPAEPAAEAS